MRDGGLALGMVALLALVACKGERQEKPAPVAELQPVVATPAPPAPAAPASTQTRKVDLMTAIHDKVAQDSVDQYEMVKRNKGSAVELCTYAGLVSAAYLQAKDEENYQKWKSIEKVDCKRAGLPQ